ncbi:Uu.00g035940.m01.CDS01 [Anthostomella pinea]|uniref:Uu.00g035940.m01.CDS01 n=1 Tax=Anthostomella pinea TaxID=933095 RepID=A0AAI8VAD0_9PEZI|nr:Uu.00g035940.m01.CDS01 [Anthostomella pinea]
MSGFVGVLFVIIVVAYLCRQVFAEKRRKDAVLRVQISRSIADFTLFGVRTLADRLILRATPNLRLHTAFDIINSFTTTDEEVHSRFLGLAKLVIRNKGNGGWVEASRIAESALDLTVSHIKFDWPFLPLAPLVRIFSFIVTLNLLFSANPKTMDLRQARIATEIINRLWLQSKGKPEPILLVDQERLHNALKALLPACYPWDDEGNPLNLIMPAYETMWRVVVLTFVSAAYQGVTLRALNDSREGLCLYPPTKRVYRAYPSMPGNSGICSPAAADVERCHREPSIWGPDALEFKPARFCRSHVLTDDMKQAYMPFGAGKHVCPAAAGFGHRTIILLVVTLAKHFGTIESGLRIRDGDVALPRSPRSLLPSGREDMEGWTLEGTNSIDRGSVCEDGLESISAETVEDVM